MKHIVNIQKATEQGVKMLRRSEIVQRRPSSWKVFFRALYFRQRYAFIEMSDRANTMFYKRTKAVRMRERDMMVNGYICEIHPVNFWTLCMFCLESFEHGFFQRFWQWHW